MFLCCSVRHSILALAVLCLSSIFANVLILNFTVICMEENATFINKDEVAISGTNISGSVQSFRYRRQLVEPSGIGVYADSGIFDRANGSQVDAGLIPDANDNLYELTEDNAKENTSTTDIIHALSTTTVRSTTPLPITTTTAIREPEKARAQPKKQTTDEDDADSEHEEDVETEPSTAATNIERKISVLVFSVQEQSVLFAAVGVGALISMLPFAWLTHRFGSRITLTVACLISTLFTAVCPTASKFGGFFALFGCRLMQGTAVGACFPVISWVISSWAPLREHSLYITILSCFTQLAAAFTMSISGVFCALTDFGGWPVIFYGHAAVCAILGFVWFLVARDDPRAHRWVTGLELDKILSGRLTLAKRRQSRGLPLKAILSSAAVWSIFVAAVGNFTALLLLLFYMPTLLSTVYHYPALDAGFLAALPAMVMLMIKLTAGYSAGRLTCRSPTVKVRVYCSVALVGAAVCLAVAAIVLVDAASIVIVDLLVVSAALLGVNAGGLYKSLALTGRQFSPVLTGGCMGLAVCLSAILVPVLVALVAPDGTAHQWRLVLLVEAVVLVGAGLIFACAGSGLPEAWTGALVKNGLAVDTDNISIEAGILEMKVIRSISPEST